MERYLKLRLQSFKLDKPMKQGTFADDSIKVYV